MSYRYVLLLFLAVTQAAVLPSGSSVSSRAEDGLGNYKFAYDEKHSTGGSFRSEAGNAHGVVGSYGLTDIDGRQRVVNYVADGHGFRAAVKTNEPGTGPESPAASVIVRSDLTKLSKPLVSTPVVAHASYTAPVIAPYTGVLPVADKPTYTASVVSHPAYTPTAQTSVAPLSSYSSPVGVSSPGAYQTAAFGHLGFTPSPISHYALAGAGYKPGNYKYY